MPQTRGDTSSRTTSAQRRPQHVRVSKRLQEAQLPFPLRPRERLRARRRKILVLKALGVVACLVLIIWGTGALSYYSRLAIRDIEVTGSRAVSFEDVARAWEHYLEVSKGRFLSRTNIFLYSKEHMAEAFTHDLPRLKSVAFSRDSWNSQTVHIALTERDAHYTWCGSDARCYMVDETGFVFAEENATTTGYVFRGGLAPGDPVRQTILRGHLSDFVTLFKKLEGMGFAVRGATVENEVDASVELTNGLVLKVPFLVDPEKTARNAQLAVASDVLQGKEADLLYIDLRFGNRVYYQFKETGEEETVL